MERYIILSLIRDDARYRGGSKRSHGFSTQKLQSRWKHIDGVHPNTYLPRLQPSSSQRIQSHRRHREDTLLDDSDIEEPGIDRLTRNIMSEFCLQLDASFEGFPSRIHKHRSTFSLSEAFNKGPFSPIQRESYILFQFFSLNVRRAFI